MENKLNIKIPNIKPIKKNQLIKNIKKYKLLMFLTFPALLTVILFQYLPIYGIIAAFQDFDITSGYSESTFVGLKNFKEVFTGPYAGEFKIIFLYTFKIALIRLLVSQPCAILFALLLNELRSIKFKKFLQTVSYLPHFLSWVIIGGMMYMVLASDGPVNTMLVNIFKFNGPINFLGDAKNFPPLLILSGLWKEVGYSSIIYLAALSSVDMQLYEAAQIDGAGKLRQTISITLPSILPTIVILFVWSVGGVLGVGFDQVWNLQNSVIRADTQVLDTYMYIQGIRNANYSYGIAVGVMQGAISLFLIMGSNFIAKKVSNIGIW